MIILITGGAGFIGSALIRYILSNTQDRVINLDALTYAGNNESIPTELSELTGLTEKRYYFEHVDICNFSAVAQLFAKYKPDVVMHLAAESHVDRSIDGPAAFINTNLVGTFNMLECARQYWNNLSDTKKSLFRFHHISTDEVYGDLASSGNAFSEQTAYKPSNPYSASKAGADHLVRAWGRTYGLPILVTNCSNNYGPYQFAEKLIPHIILNALHGKALPVYGDGCHIRDWLYVEDHAVALYKVVTKGVIGETYNIGGYNEKKNIDVVHTLCEILEELAPNKPKGVGLYRDLITFVKDRPGHDARYAIDGAKIKRELGWQPHETFETGLRKTVQWYLTNQSWWQRVLSGEYKLSRLGDN